MKKSVYIGISVVILGILIVICSSILIRGDKKENDVAHHTELQNEQKNIEQNEEMNEQMKEEENIIVENILENTIINEKEENEIQNTTSSETFEESPQTAEQKAIAMAKKDWGDKDNIEFSVDGMDERGNYIIAVRNSQTTQALAFYIVNVTTQTFTKKELN